MNFLNGKQTKIFFKCNQLSKINDIEAGVLKITHTVHTCDMYSIRFRKAKKRNETKRNETMDMQPACFAHHLAQR